MPIKLIAADMDGTLLDSAKQLPEGLFPDPRATGARGAFCASLGTAILHTLRAVRSYCRGIALYQ